MKGQFNFGQQVWWHEELVQNCPTCPNGRLTETVSNIGTGIIRKIHLSQHLEPEMVKSCDCESNCFCMKTENWDNTQLSEVDAVYEIKRTDSVGNFSVSLVESALSATEPQEQE